MKKTITINLPEPCHEDWGQMTPTERGRFCSSCEKEVVDFSQKSDEELVKELAGKPNLCGRFKASQLNRPVSLERKSSNSLLPYAASLMLPLAMMGSNPSDNSKADKNYTSLGIGRYSNFNAEKHQIITTGKITDSKGTPLFNVEIIVKESGKTEVSGMRGDYMITSVDRETLIFKKDGFVAQEVKLGRKSGELNIRLQPNPQPIELMVTGKMAIPTEEVSKNESLNYGVVTDEEMIEGEIKTEEITSEENKEDILEEAAINLIRGTVVDEYNLPLPGANVIIKGTTTGTHADFDGNFEISAEAGDILQFSYIGFETQELTITKRQPLNVTMVMDEVILGGYIGVVVTTDYKGPNLNNAQYVVEPEDYPESEYTLFTDQDRKQWRENNKKAQANEIEFKRIQIARKKAARKLKNAKRRKK